MIQSSSELTDSADFERQRAEQRVYKMLRIVALLAPMGLVLAHFNQGADTFPLAVPFILFFSALFVAAMIIDEMRSASWAVTAIAVLFLIWFALGGFGNWQLAQYEVQALIAGGALLGTGYVIGSRNGTMKVAWRALIWSLALFALVSGYEYLGPDSPTGKYGERLFAGFGSPNSAATLFAMSLLIGSASLLVRFQDPNYSKRPRGERISYLAQHEFSSFMLITLAAACLLMTMSRAGIALGLLTFIGLVGFELFRMTRRGQVQFLKRRRVYFVLVGLAVIALLLAISGEINPQHAEGLLHNVDGRLRTYAIYWDLWMEKPWFGHGLGSFNAVNDSATTLQTADALVQMGAAHNVFLQWLLQQGALGVAAMTIVMAITFYPIIAALAARSSKPRNFLRLTIALTLLVFGHGMVDYALEIPSIMWTYAFILGLAAGYSTQTKLRRSRSAD